MPCEHQTLFDEQIPAEPSQLCEIRRQVTRLAETEGLAAMAASDVALAVSEAVANVIEHGYQGQPGQFIRLQVARESARLVFVIDDDAPYVSPDNIAPRPLGELRPGGLGVHFMRALMNEVAYEPREGGGNRLRMAREL